MNEKRFRVRFEQEDGRGEIVNEKGVELTAREVVDCLNKQQELIEELQISDEWGWKRAEKFEKKIENELKQKKIYIKRLEYKVQKFKEMNGKQQSAITKLREENKQLRQKLKKYEDKEFEKTQMRGW